MSLSKNKFNHIVTEKLEKLQLQEVKQIVHIKEKSKSLHLNYKTLNIETYLSPESSITKMSKKQLLF